MTLATSVVVMGGRPVVRKVGTGPEAERVRNEASLLQAAQHPGVVRIVGRGDDGTEAWLATELAGRNNLADLALPSPRSCLATVAATLADLHDRGVVHGHLSADHVVLDRNGDPRLCSIRGGADPEVDVVALAQLAHEAAGEAPAPEQALLRSVARRVLHAAEGTRPGMRAIADFLAAGVARPETADPTGGEPAPPEAANRTWHSSPRMRLGTGVAACLLGLGLVVMAAAGLSSGASAREAAASTTPPSSSETIASVPTPPSSTTAPLSPPVTRTWPPCPPGGPDLDGDGCGEPVRLEGSVAISGDQRWQIAGPGEVALLADWDCDQLLTVTVVRISSGSVWSYDSWSRPGSETVARLVTTAGPVERAEVASVPGDDGSCAAVDLTLTSGETVTVSIAT